MPRNVKLIYFAALALFVLIIILNVFVAKSPQGERRRPPKPGEIVLGEATKVFDDSESSNLREISSDGTRYTFSSSSKVAKHVKPGDIIVGVKDEGFLRKVDSVDSSRSGEITFVTSHATLEQAIENGTLKIECDLSPRDLREAKVIGLGHNEVREALWRPPSSPGDPGSRALVVPALCPLNGRQNGIVYAAADPFENPEYVETDEDESPEAEEEGDSEKNGDGELFRLDFDNEVIYDYDGDFESTYDQATLSGSVIFDPSFLFEVEIGWFELKRVTFEVTTALNSDLMVHVGSELELANDHYELARYSFQPFIITVPAVPVPLPVVVTPTLTLNAGITANSDAQMEVRVDMPYDYTAELEYKDGDLHPIQRQNFDLNNYPPLCSANGEARGYIGPQLTFLVYGISGPFAEADAYIELLVDLLNSPNWELYAGLEVNVGTKLDVPYTLISIDKTWPEPVVDFRKLLASGDILGGAETSGNVTGLVRDGETDEPIHSATVEATVEGFEVRDFTDREGVYDLVNVPSGPTRLDFSAIGYVPTHGYFEIAEEGVTTADVVLFAPESEESGSISGAVRNATTGYGMEAATLELREGVNNTDGDILETVESGMGGSYMFDGIEPGTYTIQGSIESFDPGSVNVVCVGGRSKEFDLVLSPSMVSGQGQIRIVLTWGENPQDLDSHLLVPATQGSYGDHIFFMNAGNLLGPPYVGLDVDDTTSYGPETITIAQTSPAVYKYFVHHYAGSGSLTSTSDAVVKVYDDTGLLYTFNVPVSGEGIFWDVFDYDGSTGAITPINVVSDIEPGLPGGQ